jgi:hypothetical protein
VQICVVKVVNFFDRNMSLTIFFISPTVPSTLSTSFSACRLSTLIFRMKAASVPLQENSTDTYLYRTTADRYARKSFATFFDLSFYKRYTFCIMENLVAKSRSIPPFSGCGRVHFVALHSHHHAFIDPSKSSVFHSFIPFSLADSTTFTHSKRYTVLYPIKECRNINIFRRFLFNQLASLSTCLIYSTFSFSFFSLL